MKFLASTLLSTDPALSLPGETEHDRLRATVDLAVWAEQVGYDAFGVGERHNPGFLSSSPAVLLAHIAARTTSIRLFTTVTVLPLNDPVRVAEDYAMLDHVSGGRLELIIGKGNDQPSLQLLGVPQEEQWDRLEEGYELLRRLWREESVTWSGRFRPELREATTRPRPYQRPAPRVWHGSASSERSTELAATWGDPLYSANGFKPVEHYLGLVRHYRERLVHHGHDPADIPLAVGAHSPVIATRSQDAYELARPAFERFRRLPVAAAGGFPYESLEDFAERGSALIGSPAQVADKLLALHGQFGNELFGVGFEGFFFTDAATTTGHLERFFAEVAPVVRAELG
ncbi:LLM class flavin-dependent oxidoreductase [Nonomuraea zeae]|uniref:LLM class flavin-dependent oxidoreductase n=1 Tax=Nonomuraea zeae TaxID=1642303 RepID=A0A5S4G3Z1_9ACTN|nr:LLM class flavin-dependent oxidoreductase [Nonomuraea zeae]TMR27727.1 LLM class flavin-dependent oxidoreductase [Nonomuraea zeae]